MNRRSFVRRAGVAGVVGVAGCSGDDATPDAGGDATDAADATDAGTDAADATDATSRTTTGDPSAAFDDHPAVSELAAQPARGPYTGTAVVAFEDPSCTVCGTFHEETVPQIQSNLVEPGDGAFVFRTYPKVYPWGEPASQALEATYARSEPAFFELLDHYFSNQSMFNSQNVLAETETFLKQTSVDATAVREDAASQAYNDAVQTDLGAGSAAGAGRVTPAVFLFKDGSFVTKANGSVSYDLIAASLEL